MYQRILIANRGEIALRVIRACRELGVESVAVYSEADRDNAYLKLADEAICIGPAHPAESYLNVARIISAAEVASVEAIHPGYGFLAENSHFAEVCRDCRIDFIGPPTEAMVKLGNKVEARRLAGEAKVSVTPGSEDPVADEEEAIALAERIGYPVMVKAAAGGGGRGMRTAHNNIALRRTFHQAKLEAKAAFNDDMLYIEKFLERPRHIEVQILGDRHGNMVHLWERDCSLQRRYQKVTEESPAASLPSSVRKEMCRAALRLARAAGYWNAGTVEFLVDENDHFYFSEVNARIQVEHPVTEMLTGVDLVKEQIRIASGEKLAFRQSQIRPSGAVIECRVNAEDPENNFKPCPGRITRWELPGGPGVRIDSHVHAGYTIPPQYDSLLGKVIVHHKTRAEAIAGMRRALEEFIVEGVPTTIPLHRHLLAQARFQKAQHDTSFIERTWMK